MHFYEQDKAIEFNGLYKDIERMINNLEKIGIDVSEEKSRAAKIKRECEEGVTVGAVQMQAETQYSEGIKELREISSKLEKHRVYYYSYTEAQNIESQLNKKDITSEQIKAYANGTIALLNQIQSSDTRSYNSEKLIVERIYSLAYNVIKLEIITNGKSIVLEWVKNNSVAASFINSLIVQDLALIEKKDISNDIIKETLSSIKSSGINPSYLDEGLILFIAMQKKSSLKYIENSLLNIIKDITDSEQLIESSQTNNNSLEDKINELKNTIKRSRIYKELGLTISLIALLAGLKYGSEKAVKLIGHNEYKTDVDYFSTQIDAQAPDYPEYMPKINGFSETTLTAYDVWRQEGIFFGKYQRNIVTYDLSEVDMDSLEDFMNYDFSELSNKSEDTETAEELNADELYDKAIVEIIRLTQDENNEIFVPNEEIQEVVLVLLSITGAVLASIGEFFILKSIIKKLKSKRNTRVLKKETIREWKEGLENYKKLCEENETFKKRFIEMYQKFSQFIKNPSIKTEYTRILKDNEK